MSSIVTATVRRMPEAAFAVGITGVAAAAGVISVLRPSLSLVIVLGGVVLAAVSQQPVILAVLAVPAMFGAVDLGVGGGLGVSDAVLISASALALPALMRTHVRGATSPVMCLLALYLALLLPSLAANVNAAAVLEWVHRAVLVGSALVVGAWIRAEHRERSALRAITAAACVVAASAVLGALKNGFEPVFPLIYHKNYAGTLLALVLVLVLVLPHVVALRGVLRPLVLLLLTLGTLATQSRGALLGAALGVLIWFFSPGSGPSATGKTRILGLLVAVGFGTFASFSVQQQLTAANLETNSAGVRFDVEAATRDLWRDSPVVGVGLRYFNTGDYGRFVTASNNALNSEMAESGIIGTTGFVVLHVGTVIVLVKRRQSPLAAAALAVFSGQLLHGMVDIYWSSGLTPLPFLVAGMALADRDVESRAA
ncbi:MAG: O-Antigen ligase [Frankiales bacterium]|jgi:hypothetical protein|nr:O-Antigen ligase [Frankiales bacterium]